MNELTHCKRLSSVKSNSGVKFLTPDAFPGSHCPLHTALALSSNIKGMSTLVVGTSECGTYSRNVIYKSKHRDTGLHWMYVLDGNEVVFGCRKGLMETVQAMDQAGAKYIMLILTCVPEVIGEDAEGIVHELQPKVNARLCFVQLGHFKCNSHPSGFWKSLMAFGGLMQPVKTDAARINVLGRSPKEEHIPTPMLLTELSKKGFSLRMLAPKSEIEDFIAAPDARVNLVLSPYMNPLAEWMKAELGIPYFSLHDLYAVSQLDDLLLTLAQKLQIDWGDAFTDARSEALALEERGNMCFQGLSYITTPRNPLLPIPLASYLTKFQMSPLILHIDEFYPDDRRHAKELLSLGEDPILCHMVNDRADAEILERLQPALSFGEIYEGTGTIPAVPYLYELYGQVSYERTAQLLNRMLQTWECAQQTEGGMSCGRA